MRKKEIRKMWIVLVIAVIVLFCFIIVIFPSGSGEIPLFYSGDGKELPDSLSEKCYLEVDGDRLGMILLAKDVSSPVLLVCGGGPGIAQYLLEDMYPSRLADLFTVCYFEYRGTGLSYDTHMEASDMTTERYVADILAVTEYLKERFNQEKIYLMGHSFGSYVALKTVDQYPNNYAAYLAMSQLCDQEESEYQAYDYMVEQYAQMGKKSMTKKFENYPIRASEEIYEKYFSSPLRDKGMHELGVGTTHDMSNVITGIFLPSLKCTAYTRMERIHIWQGKMKSSSFPVTKDAWQFNAFDSVQSIQVPVYFFAGKYDRTCSYALQEKYYQQIEAPEKEFYSFENAAHSPIYEEPEQAEEYLNLIR